MKEPMFMPVAIGLVDSTGKDTPLTSIYSDGMLRTLSNDGQPIFTAVLQFKKEEEFIFNNVPERPVPSLLRGYSAPIRLDSGLTGLGVIYISYLPTIQMDLTATENTGSKSKIC